MDDETKHLLVTVEYGFCPRRCQSVEVVGSLQGEPFFWGHKRRECRCNKHEQNLLCLLLLCWTAFLSENRCDVLGGSWVALVSAHGSLYAGCQNVRKEGRGWEMMKGGGKKEGWCQLPHMLTFSVCQAQANKYWQWSLVVVCLRLANTSFFPQ